MADIDLRGTNPGAAFPARLTGRAFAYSKVVNTATNVSAQDDVYLLARFPAGTMITHAGIVPSTAEGATGTVDILLGATAIDSNVDVNTTTATYTITDTVTVSTAAADLKIKADHALDAAIFTVQIAGFYFG